MDFATVPPEINSARMYSGPGSGPMVAGAAAWDGLSAELNAAAAAYTSVIAELTSGPWQGPSSSAMTAAATQYVAWMTTAATRAEEAGIQAKQAVAAYEAAFAMTVPPAVIAANRSLLLTLIATNVLGQNTAAIAATESEYGEMWAQDATAMYAYAGAAANASRLTPLTAAADTTDPSGPGGQLGAIIQALVTDIDTQVGNRLSTLLNAVPTALQGVVSASSPADVLASLSTLVTTFGGANPFTYPTTVLPALTALASTNFGKAVNMKLAAKPSAPAATPGPAPGALAAAKMLNAGWADSGSASGTLRAHTGAARTVGALTVPPSWATGLPPIRPAAVTSTAFSVAVAGDPETLLNNIAFASAAGGFVGVAASGIAPRPAAKAKRLPMPPQNRGGSLEAIHEAIVRDVLAAADFWGGFGSRACQDFITRLGNNFEVLYSHLQKDTTSTQLGDSNTTGADQNLTT